MVAGICLIFLCSIYILNSFKIESGTPVKKLISLLIKGYSTLSITTVSFESAQDRVIQIVRELEEDEEIILDTGGSDVVVQ